MAVYFSDSVKQVFLTTPSASGSTFYDIATIDDFWDVSSAYFVY